MAIELNGQGPAQQDSFGQKIKRFVTGAASATKNFFGSADKATDALYENELLTETKAASQSEFQQLIQNYDRQRTPFDKLDLAINDIGTKLIAKAQEKLQTPESKEQFRVKFEKHLAAQKLKVYSDLRADKVFFINTKLSEQINNLVDQASNANESEIPLINGQINDIISGAVQAGAISTEEASAAAIKASGAIQLKKFESLISTNPTAAVQALEQQQDNLDPRQFNSLMRQAAGAQRDAVEQRNAYERKAQILSKEQSAIQKERIFNGILTGEVGEKEIESLIGHVPAKDIASYKSFLKRDRGIKETKETELASLSEADISELTPVKASSHYKYIIQNMGGEEKPALMDKAIIASKYRQPISEFTAELKNTLASDEVNAEQAFQAYQYLELRSPRTLDKIDSKTDKLVAVTKSLMEDSGLSFNSALRQAKQQVLEKDSDVLSERETAFRKKKVAGEIPGFIQSVFDDEVFQYKELIGKQQQVPLAPGLAAKAERIYKQAYLETGDDSQAKKLAAQRLRRSTGYTEFNGGEIMAHAPELYYPDVPSAILKENLQASVKGLIPANAGEVKITADEFTFGKTGRDGKQKISYVLSYINDMGLEVPLENDRGELLRWVPDAKEIEQTGLQVASEKASVIIKAETVKREQLQIKQQSREKGGLLPPSDLKVGF